MPPRSASKRMPVAPTKFDASPKVSRESKLKASAAAVAEALEKAKAATEASAAKAAKTKAAETKKEATPPPSKQTEKVEDTDSDTSAEADRRKKKKSKNPKPERTPEENAIYLANLVATAVATALAKNAAATSVPESLPALDNQFVPYAAEDLMSVVSSTLSALPAEGGASSRSPFVTHGVRFVNSLAPAAQALAESHCSNASLFLESNKTLTELNTKATRGTNLSAAELAQIFVLLEDERENVAQIATVWTSIFNRVQ